MKSVPSHHVGRPELRWVLVAAVICLLAVISLVKMARSPQVVEAAPSARLQAAPTAMAPATAPVTSQENTSSFPPRSDLCCGLGQGGETVPGVSMLGFPPSSAPVLGPPSLTRKPEAKQPNSVGMVGTPIQAQMQIVPPSVSDKMIIQLPRSTEMEGVVMLYGVPGP